MTTFPLEAVVALVVMLILAVFLGRIYRPKPGGFTDGDTREVLALVIVAAVLFMVAMGKEIPDFLVMAFGAVLTYWMPSAKSAAIPPPGAPRVELPAVPPANGQSGFARLGLMVAISIASAAVLMVTGCGVTISKIQDGVDATLGKAGIGTNLVNEGREKIAEAEAKRIGRELLPEGAQKLPGAWLDDNGNELTNGVSFVRWIKVEQRHADRRPVAPSFTPAPANTPAASNAPSSAPAQVPSIGSATAPAAEQTLPAGGPSSALVTEQREFRLVMAITNATGALPLTGATAEAVVLVNGAAGWMTNGGNVEAAGRIVSISNAPIPVDTAALTFDSFACVVTNGTLLIASTGGDVEFHGSADLTSGAISGVALPADGSSAEAFFQRVELAGSGALVAVSFATNAAPPVVVTNTTPAGPADAIPAALCRTLGKHQFDMGKVPVTRTLKGASLRGDQCVLSFDKLNWSTKSSKGKTVDGRVCMFWPDGKGGFEGGHFDWHGQGQTVKTMANIFGGYLDGQKPPPGSPVFFCIVNNEQNERTQIVRSSNDWK